MRVLGIQLAEQATSDGCGVLKLSLLFILTKRSRITLARVTLERLTVICSSFQMSESIILDYLPVYAFNLSGVIGGPGSLALPKLIRSIARNRSFHPYTCQSNQERRIRNFSHMEPPAQRQDAPAAACTSSGTSAAPDPSLGPSSSSGLHQPAPTHKPLTHNPPSSPTTAPWPSPATGSPFPQLARPADNALGVISSSGKADRMSPTAAPWVAAPAAAAAGPQSSQLMTGKPVQGQPAGACFFWVGWGSAWESTTML